MTSATNTETTADLPKGVKLSALDPTFREQPYPVLNRLRDVAPVLQDGEFNRLFVSRFDDVRHILRDKDMSVDPRKADPTSYIARVTGIANMAQNPEDVSMVFLDDPDHRRLRGLMSKAFTPKAVEAMRPRVREIAHTLLEKIPAGEFDLMNTFAGPLPVIVIAEMLGINTGDRESFKRWSQTWVASFFNIFRTEEQRVAAAGARAELEAYFQNMIDLRRRSLGADLISNLVNAELEGDRLTDREIITQCNLLLIAGNITTTDLIGNGVKALLDHPTELVKLRARPELINNAVEEMLRYDSPVVSAGRIVQQEHTIRGCPVHRGESITLSLAAANHDAEVNPNPERFDIERENIQHQSFGGGKHLCLGAPLARVEAQEAIIALLTRCPNLRLSPRGHRYNSVPAFRSMSEFWCLN